MILHQNHRVAITNLPAFGEVNRRLFLSFSSFKEASDAYHRNSSTQTRRSEGNVSRAAELMGMTAVIVPEDAGAD